MEDNRNAQTFQPLESMQTESVDERQRSEEGTLLESNLPTVAALVEPTVEEPSLPAEGPCQQQGTAIVGDKEVAGGSSSSSSSSGGSRMGSGGSGFDADIEESDYTVSVASSVGLTEAYDSALEELERNNQREMNTFVWIDKCLGRVATLSYELRQFATGVLESSGIGSINVQSTISECVSIPSRVDIYKPRLRAVEEYLLAAYEHLAVQENARMAELEAKTEETVGSSEGKTESRSKDFVESVVLEEVCEDTCGKTKGRSSEDDGKTVRLEDELEAKLGSLTTSSGESAESTVKTNSRNSAAGDAVNPTAVQQEVTSEDVTNSRGEGEEDGADEERRRQATATSSSNEPKEVRIVGVNKQLAVYKRAQLIQKLVTRQREALSRMASTAETRVLRLNSATQFILTCVKCAVCVCNSTVNAHVMAQVALKIAESSGAADDVDTVREAAAAASRNTELAVMTCEKAVEHHKDAVGVLEDVQSPLVLIQDYELLAEHTVGEVAKHSDDIKQLVDRGDVSLHVLAKKLALMESSMDTLSYAVKRGKDVNQITKQLAKTFDDAAFQLPVVAAVFGTTQFAVRTMTAAKNALSPLSRLVKAAPSEEPTGLENPTEIVPSMGHGHTPKDDVPTDQANDPQNAGH